MRSVEVLRRATPDDPEIVEISKIRDEWVRARRQVDNGTPGGACSVPGCRTMSFVMLKTNAGRRAMCLRHFEMLGAETV